MVEQRPANRHRRLRGIGATLAAAGLTVAMAGGDASIPQNQSIHDNPTNIETIIRGEHPDVIVRDLKQIIDNVYDTNPQAEQIYPKESALANFAHAQVGFDGTDRKASGQAQTAFLTEGFVSVYLKTGDEASLKAAETSYNFGLTRWGTESKPHLDEILRKTRIAEIINGTHSEITTSSLQTSIDNVYDTNPQAEQIYPKESALANFAHAQVGFDGTDRKASGQAQTAFLTEGFVSVYLKTGDEASLKAAETSYNFGLTRWGVSSKTGLDQSLLSVFTESIGVGPIS